MRGTRPATLLELPAAFDVDGDVLRLGLAGLVWGAEECGLDKMLDLEECLGNR